LVVGRASGESGAPLAYELKFLLPADVAGQVERWAVGEGGLSADRHGDSTRGGRYTTTTTYLDTAELDVFYRREGYARHRYRVRRYGDAGEVHLECKTKKGDLVRKQRTAVKCPELAQLDGNSPQDWPGGWFARRAAELSLRPASMVTYQRAAFVGVCAEGPLRVTVDWDARCRLCRDRDEWLPQRLEHAEGADVLGGRAIVELKYLTALPLPFKSLMRKLTLEPGGVSKYRIGREVLGLPGAKA